MSWCIESKAFEMLQGLFFTLKNIFLIFLKCQYFQVLAIETNENVDQYGKKFNIENQIFISIKQCRKMIFKNDIDRYSQTTWFFNEIASPPDPQNQNSKTSYKTPQKEHHQEPSEPNREKTAPPPQQRNMMMNDRRGQSRRHRVIHFHKIAAAPVTSHNIPERRRIAPSPPPSSGSLKHE